MHGSIQINVDGGRGFYATDLAGTQLSAAQQQALGADVQAAQAVAAAIAQALAQARAAGITAFAASDASAFTLPDGVSTAARDRIFNEIVGRPWAGGEMRLRDWAAAAQRIEQWAGKRLSSLPPDAGGGVQNVNGQWYVNGEAYSMAELFTANRVNTYHALDETLKQSLNTIAANNRLVNRLTEVLKAGREASSGWARELIATHGYYASGYLWDNNRLRSDAVSWDTVKSLADAVLGPGSVLANSISSNSSGTGTLRGDDWKTALDQLGTIIDAKTADNQVAQQRMESVMSLRGNVLDGLGSMLKGQQNMNASVSRNF